MGDNDSATDPGIIAGLALERGEPAGKPKRNHKAAKSTPNEIERGIDPEFSPYDAGSSALEAGGPDQAEAGHEEGAISKKAKSVANRAVLRFDRLIKLLAGSDNKLTADEKRELRESIEGLSEADIDWLSKLLKHGGRLMVLAVAISIAMHRIKPDFSIIEAVRGMFVRPHQADEEAISATYQGVPG